MGSACQKGVQSLKAIHDRPELICKTQGQLVEAEGFYRKSQEIWEVFAGDRQAVEVHCTLLIIYSRLSYIYQTQRATIRNPQNWRKPLPAKRSSPIQHHETAERHM